MAAILIVCGDSSQEAPCLFRTETDGVRNAGAGEHVDIECRRGENSREIIDNNNADPQPLLHPDSDGFVMQSAQCLFCSVPDLHYKRVGINDYR